MFRLTCCLGLVLGGTVQAHELFLQPQSYQLDMGQTIEAEVVVGEEFDGGRSMYNPNAFRRFDLIVGDAVAPIEGRLGDLPAVSVEAGQDGLHVLLFESTDKRLTYKEFEKFQRFVAHKDLAGALDDHAARGLSTEEFVEAYSRYAKSLIAVGEGAGADRRFGLETEIVALANPYTAALTDGLPVQVFYQDAPRPDVQVELFEKLGDAVEISLHRTDADGIALLPVKSGAIYMVDAVVLRVPSDALAEETGAVWETLWANLTFAVPE